MKCPMCQKPYQYKKDLIHHMELKHPNDIPNGMSPAKYLYSLSHGGETTGKCRICSNETQFDEKTGRAKVFCENPKCKEAFAKLAQERLKLKYGVTHLLNDQKHQMYMLSKRKISGEYEWSDGKTKIPYVGSYERRFLEFMDNFLDFDPSTIYSPCPFDIIYHYEGNNLTYTPDFYIDILDLVVEIKHGGDNPNNHHKIQAVDVAKDKAKEKAIKDSTSHNYIKIVDNNFRPLLQTLFKLIEDSQFESKQRLFILNESTNDGNVNNMNPRDLYVTYFADPSNFGFDVKYHIHFEEDDITSILDNTVSPIDSELDELVTPLTAVNYITYKYAGDSNIQRDIQNFDPGKRDTNNISDIEYLNESFPSIFSNKSIGTINQMMFDHDFTVVKQGRLER